MTERDKSVIRRYQKLTGLRIKVFEEPKRVMIGYLHGEPVVNVSGARWPIKHAVTVLRTYNLRRICKKLIEKVSGKCARCGLVRRLHLHHIKKRSQGGMDNEENLELLCVECHKDEHGG